MLCDENINVQTWWPAYHLSCSNRAINMSARLCQQASFLRLLQKASPRVRRSMLKSHCNKDFILCMCECAKNLLKGNVPLSPAQLRTLRRHKQKLRQLAVKKTSLAKKKKLVQSGGFLGSLLLFQY